jgi:hypothetical protein
MNKFAVLITFTMFCMLFTLTGCTDNYGGNTVKVTSSRNLTENTHNEISTNDTETTTDNANDYTYVNNLLGYSVNFPNMNDRLVITENDNGSTDICSKMINDYLMEHNSNIYVIATIFPILKSEYPTKEDLENYLVNDTPVPTYYLGETIDNYICYFTASDAVYPIDDDLKNEQSEILSILADTLNFEVLEN